MSETAVNEDGGFVFGQKNVDGDGVGSSTPHLDPLPGRSSGRGRQGVPLRSPHFNGNPDVQPEAVAHPMKQRANGSFRGRILATNPAHVPGSAGRSFVSRSSSFSGGDPTLVTVEVGTLYTSN
jgi:hypothetical protein